MALDNLVWIANGYIAKALERGFAAGASDVTVPMFAQIYMVNLLANYVQGLPVPATQLPYWILCVGHAVSPKSVPFGHGKVSYKFQIGGTLPYSPTSYTQVIGATTYGSKYTLAGPGGVPINTFPVASSALVGGYTDQLGASAFQELAQFMASNTLGKSARGARLVPSSFMTPFATDVSAFAVFALPEGVGASGFGGGLYGQAQLEVPLAHPIFALASCAFDDAVLTILPTRNFNKAIPIAGDPVTLGALMSSVFSIRELSAKASLRFKPVDILLFGDLVAQWVQQIVQSYLIDVSQATGESFSNVLDPVICPITLQEMLLLLRNTIMGAFKETQAAVQGIVPFRPNNTSDNEFTPCVASATQCALDTLDMSLPQPLIENIRALVAREIMEEEGPAWYIPLLGQYFNDLLQATNYEVTVSIGGVPTTVPVFKTGALFEKTEINSKGEEIVSTFAENPDFDDRRHCGKFVSVHK